MTAAEFKAALTRLGYSQAGFAAYLGVHRVTVQHWAMHRYPVPRYVEIIIGFMLQERQQQLGYKEEG